MLDDVIATDFVSLLLNGDRRRAQSYAREALERHGVQFVYEKVVGPALEEIGQLWQQNRVSVADEHLATTTAECAVAALYALFRWPPRGPRAVIACVEGERHQFGARMVADLLALDGWDERFLGADVPVADLAGEVRRVAPKMLALSVTLPLNATNARRAIELVRAGSPDVRIILGGRATAEPTILRALRGDASAHSGSEAVEVARGWK